MRTLLRWLIFLLIAGGLIGGGVYSWGLKRSSPQWLTAQVTRGNVEVVVNSTGTIKPVQSVTVGAFVSGPIAEMFVDYNSIVKKGDLMARIDPRLPAAAVDRDRAALATQRAEYNRVNALLQQAKNNEERARKLRAVNKDYLSDVELDQYSFATLALAAQLEVAQAAIAQAEANLKNSEANLEYTEIRSPVDGMVIERKVDPGQTVAAAFQTPELFIVAPDLEKHMHVFATVDEADIGLIHKAQERGKDVKFTVDAYPEDLFTGKIFQIRKSSTTTQNVVTYPVVIETTNPDMKLMPGMTANLSFQIEMRESVVRIPSLALRFVPLPSQVRPADRHRLEATSPDSPESMKRLSASDKAAAAKARRERLVWAAEPDGLLRAIPVKLGLIDTSHAEVLEGDIQEGQALVIGLETAGGGTTRR
jgi:HlyD family secretion protein